MRLHPNRPDPSHLLRNDPTQLPAYILRAQRIFLPRLLEPPHPISPASLAYLSRALRRAPHRRESILVRVPSIQSNRHPRKAFRSSSASVYPYVSESNSILAEFKT